MITLTTFLATPLLVLASTVFATDTCKLTRSFKADESTVYLLSGTADVEGQQIKFDAEIESKVVKVLEEGAAKVTFSTKKLNLVIDGNSIGDMPLDDFDVSVDARGFPDRLPGGGPEWMFTMIALGGIVPGKEVAVGDSFEIDWANKEKSSTVKGKGKLDELGESEGQRVAKVGYELDVQAEGESSSAKVTMSCTFEASECKPQKFEGKVTLSEGTIAFTVKKK